MAVTSATIFDKGGGAEPAHALAGPGPRPVRLQMPGNAGNCPA
jgi:hypothetical protein